VTSRQQRVFDLQDLLAQALASLDAAAASVARHDVDAVIDDLLAARLLLTTLMQSS